MRKLRIIIIAVAFLFLAGIFFVISKKRPAPIPVPPAISYDAITTSQPAVSDSALPAEINLNIPFTSQAPHQNWDLPYQEFCEEASALMAASFVKGENIVGLDDADKKMLAIKDFEEKRLGTYKDTSAEETAVIFKEFYGLEKVEVVFDPTEQIIKKYLAEGRAVVVPAAGRELGNPNYRSPGPLYHMLVIKGYTKTGDFITNDPGTRNGADYVYKPAVLLKAMHDWNRGDVYTGEKVAIIVG
jgi:hypothetical protein